MKLHRIVIPKGDEANVDVEVYNHQPEGLYRYIPQEGDELTLILHKEDEEVLTVTADTTKPDFVYFNIDTTDLERGIYTYDILIKTVDEEKPHHIVMGQELKIV